MSKSLARRAAQALASLLALWGAGSAFAAPDKPIAALKKRDAEIRAALPPDGKKPGPAEKKKLQEVVNAAVDFEALAAHSLGDKRALLDDAQWKEFLPLFTRVVRDASAEQLDVYRSKKIDYVAERVEGDKAEVSAKVEVDGSPTEIVYRLSRRQGKWLIADLSVDGLSTAEAYRAAFQKILAESGPQGLLEKLKSSPR